MSYGSVQTVIQRTAATADTFGFDTEQELTDFVQTNLDQASSAIDDYCGRDFELHTGEVSYRTRTDRRTLRVPKRPLVNIQSIEDESGDTIDPSEYRIKDDSMRNGNSGRIERTERKSSWLPHREYIITYDWGYESVPGIVTSVANELVIDTLNEAAAERSASGLESVSMDGYSVQYAIVDAANKGAITAAQKGRLDNLRVVPTA